MSRMSDLYTARSERNAALDKVASNAPDFMVGALASIDQLPAGEWTGEQVRMALSHRGIVPHHHNAWGSLISTAVRRGILIDTGRYGHMTAKKSHARRTPIYWIR